MGAVLLAVEAEQKLCILPVKTEDIEAIIEGEGVVRTSLLSFHYRTRWKAGYL
jgi:hypothetical protein